MSGFLDLEVIQAKIASGTSLSAEADIGSKLLVGVVMPATWDAASVTFQVSLDGGQTFLDLHNVTAEVSLVAAASQFIALDPAAYRGVNAIKVRSGTSASAVNQTADRIVGLAVRSFVP